MLSKVKAILERFTGVDALRRELKNATRALATTTAWHKQAWQERDAALDQLEAMKAECEAQGELKMRALQWAKNLNADLETARRTAALHRSLIAILRDVNRDLDERLNSLESKPEVESTT